MATTTTIRIRCPGSGKRTGGFPGDQDVCPCCEQWVTVNREGYLRQHKARPARINRDLMEHQP